MQHSGLKMALKSKCECIMLPKVVAAMTCLYIVMYQFSFVQQEHTKRELAKIEAAYRNGVIFPVSWK